MNDNVMKSNVVYQQVQGTIVSNMDGEKVMLSIENGKYYNLGEIGGEIWDLLERPLTLESLVEKLVNRYEISLSKCSEEVQGFLDELKEQNLIEVK
ncbi:lasso peptide biosynthesis PqqD family chaperone [Alkalihalobacillus pseudalcaliphilus]|uniref:lasso peptide biosynthesis PqqD family chaperone n=1 Tax=Alkalihalobacillus pseudalcaliphilus TaxID=79884 RepID=UPI00064DA346|nr:lasso peptide biosynthesis PqqD family chaperone [Alkalihalobacillus pseudalcaliphilus]KMK75025.1 metallophosphoesterase [Alkalihalobacillus pseudalcaliphilus]